MPTRTRRVKCRNNKDKFVFTNDLKLIKPYVVYQICIKISFVDSDLTTFYFTTKILVLF